MRVLWFLAGFIVVYTLPAQDYHLKAYKNSYFRQFPVARLEAVRGAAFEVDNLLWVLDSDVMLAAHHGARNVSCPDFIEAVSPEYVIFSAGNTHKHPHQLTATNYLNHGVAPTNMFRTDIGKTPLDNDNNDCNDEWIGTNHSETEPDISFDDHIRIQITERGKLLVGYLD
jgi:hypothetical protein